MRANETTALHLKRQYFFKQMFFMSEFKTGRFWS